MDCTVSGLGPALSRVLFRSIKISELETHNDGDDDDDDARMYHSPDAREQFVCLGAIVIAVDVDVGLVS